MGGNFGTSSVLVVWCAQLCVSVSLCLCVSVSPCLCPSLGSPRVLGTAAFVFLRSGRCSKELLPGKSSLSQPLYSQVTRDLWLSKVSDCRHMETDARLCFCLSVSLSLCLCLTGAQSRLANNVHDNISATLRGDFKVDQDGRRSTAGARTNRARPDRARSAARDKTELSLCRCPCSRTSRPSLPPAAIILSHTLLDLGGVSEREPL